MVLPSVEEGGAIDLTQSGKCALKYEGTCHMNFTGFRVTNKLLDAKKGTRRRGASRKRTGQIKSM